MTKLDNFCLRKLKSFFGYEYDEKISYQTISSEIKTHLPKWIWPSTRVQMQRLQFFIKSLNNLELVNILTPEIGAKRKVGRPRFRIIDAIINDLEDIADLSFADYKFHEFSPKNRAKNVTFYCKLHQDQIFKLIEDFTPG